MEPVRETRPTPQSLPRLTIPSSRYKTEPEEITTTRVESFLDFCTKHKKAPLTRLPSLPLVPPPPSPDSESDTDKTKNKNKGSRSLEKGLTSLKIENPPDTLAFTENEQDVLDARKAEYEHAKEQHTEAILELQIDPKNRETIQKCRHWRQIRERLNLEMSLIWDRREIRRKFRKDANNPKGIQNW
ncbi:hypothetical protein F4805DRAFT_477115 [Annulohypoxylon moriforme]|nr:hypothetical protein F4805DRAFT_477115 [Annulohypoxylon moriforme]